MLRFTLFTFLLLFVPAMLMADINRFVEFDVDDNIAEDIFSFVEGDFSLSSIGTAAFISQTNNKLWVMEYFNNSTTYIDFQNENTLVMDWDTPTVVDIIQMSNDGFPGVVAGAAGAGEIIWWQETGEEWEFDSTHVSTNVPGVVDLANADFDLDGRMDIVAATGQQGGIQLCLQIWDELFVQVEVAAGRDTVRAVEAGDFDEDGDSDLLAAEGDTLFIWENDGTGTFSPIRFAQYDGVSLIETADLDSDGDLDILAASSQLGTLRYWKNTGTGFIPLLPPTDTPGISSLTSLDLDVDGDIDVIVSLKTENRIEVFEQLANGAFRRITVSQAIDDPLVVQSIRLGKDDDYDILALSATSPRMHCYQTFRESAWQGEVIHHGVDPWVVQSSDFDLDGDLDLIVSFYGNEDRLELFVNEDGIFESSIIESRRATSISINDYNNDGFPDFIANQLTGPVRLYINNWDNTFTEQELGGQPYGDWPDLVSGDLNNDNLVDIVVYESDSTLYVYLQQNDGTFVRETVPIQYPENHAFTFQVVDINEDTYNDIIIGDNGLLLLLENDGSGLAYTGVELSEIEGRSALVCDLDLDGHIDIVNCLNQELEIFRNMGFGIFEMFYVPVTGSDLDIADINLDGYPDILTINSEYSLQWYENLNSPEFEFEGHFLTEELRHYAHMAELDGYSGPEILTSDGSLDLCLWHNPYGVDPVEEVSIDLTPFAPPVILPPIGGEVVYHAHFGNSTQNVFAGQIWSEFVLPNGGTWPLQNLSVTLQPGQHRTRRWLTEAVPQIAPPGQYLLRAYIGYYATNTVLDEDSFTFVKVPNGPNASVNDMNSGATPDQFVIACAPNPFNAMSTIELALPRAGEVSIVLYDLLGRQVSVLADGFSPPGYHQYTLDASALASGMYFVTVNAKGSGQITRKVMVMK